MDKKIPVPSLTADDIISAMVDSLILVGRDGRILKANRATFDLLGYKADELIGKPITKILPTSVGGSTLFAIFAEAGLRELLKNGYVRDVEIVYRAKDGQKIPMHFSGSEVREKNGELQGIVCVAKDLRELKRAQEELSKTAESLASSNEALEQFAYVASHDLREPLRTVSTYLQFLDRKYSGKLDSDAKEYMAHAVDGSNRMQMLLVDLLDYSRVTSRGKPFQPTSGERIFEQATTNLKVLIEETKARVTHDYPLPTVVVDEVQIVRLVQNLIDNAIKFRGDKHPRVHVSAKRSGEDWVFTIADNGIGIPIAYTKNIFEMFRRVHSEAKYPGTGMGLAVCKKIVERHGGRIWVKSTPGKGSRFFFTIPVRVQTKEDLDERKIAVKRGLKTIVEALKIEDNIEDERNA